jgi:hypothetical protein
VCWIKRSEFEIGHLGLARPRAEELRVSDDDNVSRRTQIGRRREETRELAAALSDWDDDAK